MLSDAGIYYCIARTGRDVDVMPLRLAVEESSIPPLGEHVGPPAKGAVGEPISLSCEVSGSPLPYLSWVLPDGNTVRRGLAVSGGVTMQSNGSLSLPNPTKRDAGHYRCIAPYQKHNYSYLNYYPNNSYTNIYFAHYHYYFFNQPFYYIYYYYSS
uniref:Ig-like domain-containing protein n=1 Tax=Labrus bergylta TaxID=56723 RepID=A0A3Q3EGN8_9LABR